jgi:hypothetical protein
MLDIGNHLRDLEILEELIKKPSAASWTTNQLPTKVTKPNQAVLAGSDLRAVMKPEGGYMYKDRPSIQGAGPAADVQAALAIMEVKELRVQVRPSALLKALHRLKGLEHQLH